MTEAEQAIRDALAVLENPDADSRKKEIAAYYFNINGTPTAIAEIMQELDALRKDAASKQAKIDALMWEYCPGEMTAAQKLAWAAHQRVDANEDMP